MRWLLALVIVAAARPAVACGDLTEPYIEPSIFLATRPVGVVDRVSFGWHWRRCQVGGYLRLGGSAYLSGYAGLGGELELGAPIAEQMSAGLRLSFESSSRYSGGLATAGVRLHFDDAAFAEVDAFRPNGTNDAGNRALLGAMFGAGIQRTPGVAIVGVELLVGFVAIVLLGSLASHNAT